MTVHSALPERLEAAVGEVLEEAEVPHAAHGDERPFEAAERAAADPDAIALIGPLRSADVAEATEVTAPAGLALIAPFATWVGVTRDDEPGCDDAADHHGTVLRLVARDSVIAGRIADWVRAAGARALVVAGEHDYGLQLDGQLHAAGLPRTEDPEDADVLVLAGLAGEPEIERAAALAPLALVAFDGVQGADLGVGRDVRIALPTAPDGGADPEDLLDGIGHARRAAELVVAALHAGARDRASLLDAARELGFDHHGDPLNPPVWLWRAGADWTLEPDRPL